jgi:transcriptional regulator with XRE-family HTH domain
VSQNDFKQHVGQHLKTLRKRKRLSLDATAALTHVSKANLGQIEREETSPTIATLWKIANGLETSFSAFFADEPTFQSSDKIFPQDNNMKISTLFPFHPDTRIEVFIIDLLNYHQQMSSPHHIGVIEHVIVLEGEVEVYFDGLWHLLKSGESVKFHCDQPHGYKAKTALAKFQNIISYPKG